MSHASVREDAFGFKNILTIDLSGYLFYNVGSECNVLCIYFIPHAFFSLHVWKEEHGGS